LILSKSWWEKRKCQHNLSTHRLTSTITRSLTAILNQKMEVQFIVVEESNEDEIEDTYGDEIPAPLENPAGEYDSYDRLFADISTASWSDGTYLAQN
jgi:hypothetical protein